MSDRMDNDLPMPISSARTPPPVSEGGATDLSFVIAWQKLQEQLAIETKTLPDSRELTKSGHLTRWVATARIQAALDQPPFES
jgi:hypothetical protein